MSKIAYITKNIPITFVIITAPLNGLNNNTTPQIKLNKAVTNDQKK